MATVQREYDRAHLEERNPYNVGEKAILFDSSRCSGCKGCMVACKTWNMLPSPLKLNSQEWNASLQCPYDLGPNTRLTITFDELPSTNPYRPINWAIGRRACMHCTEAGCVTVCPSGALYYDETGMVTYNADKCIGCSYCVGACPFDVPRHTGKDDLSGASIRINKCTGCPDRIRHGMDPACVTTCQPGALMFGDREEMVKVAEERLETLKAKGFEDASIYGLTELGGTHVIHVLKYSIDGYELPANPSISWMTSASQVMKPVLGIGFIALIAGLGLCFISGIGYKRDELRYDEVTNDVIDVDTGEVVKHIDKEAGER
ncbi:MAG: 4Fe-4S dicluster domain-containing protein [Eggerthellaceae bacterium]|nr:4Fe-4S dicluster domain-containing protein [Eggerthellaceae bacterium]